MCFQSKSTRTNKDKKNSPGNSPCQNSSVAISSKFYIWNNFKDGSWDGSASQTNLARLQLSPTFSYHTEIRQHLALPGLDHFLKFSWVPIRCHDLQTRGNTLESTTPTFLRGGVGGFWSDSVLWNRPMNVSHAKPIIHG